MDGRMPYHDTRLPWRDRLKALGHLPEVAKRGLFDSLLSTRMAEGAVSDLDLFEAAYGDHGQTYWGAVLSEPIEAGLFAYILGLHVAKSYGEIGTQQRAVRRALLDMAELGLIRQITADSDDGTLRGPKIDAEMAARWLAGKPLRKHLVPLSLASLLKECQPEAAQTPAFKADRPRGRPAGTGFESSDALIVTRMLELKVAGLANSLSAAARQIIGRDGKGAEGTGDVEAKVKRLVARAKRPSKKAG